MMGSRFLLLICQEDEVLGSCQQPNITGVDEIRKKYYILAVSFRKNQN